MGPPTSGVDPQVLETHLQELRRGTVVLAALASLREPGYGYALLQSLADTGIAADANTVYPLLRRLEKQGLLTSEWNTEESRPRKFYRTSAQGEAVLGELLGSWGQLNEAIGALTGGAQATEGKS